MKCSTFCHLLVRLPGEILSELGNWSRGSTTVAEFTTLSIWGIWCFLVRLIQPVQLRGQASHKVFSMVVRSTPHPEALDTCYGAGRVCPDPQKMMVLAHKHQPRAFLRYWPLKHNVVLRTKRLLNFQSLHDPGGQRAVEKYQTHENHQGT